MNLCVYAHICMKIYAQVNVYVLAGISLAISAGVSAALDARSFEQTHPPTGGITDSAPH